MSTRVNESKFGFESRGGTIFRVFGVNGCSENWLFFTFLYFLRRFGVTFCFLRLFEGFFSSKKLETTDSADFAEGLFFGEGNGLNLVAQRRKGEIKKMKLGKLLFFIVFV